MASTEYTLYEVRDGAAWIIMNRPESRNPLSAGLVNELYDHLVEAESEEEARCIVVTGVDPAFCAGADLKGSPGQPRSDGRVVSLVDVLNQMRGSRKPVIAAVNGYAFAGGLGLVAGADIGITSDKVVYSFREVRIGVIPAIISVVCLRKLGTHHGARLFVTGERFSAEQAVEWGLVHRAVPHEELASAVQEEIDAIKLGAPNAVAEAKKLANTVLDLSIEEGFKLTAEWSGRLFRSEEGLEGIASFREKRDPSWVKK